MYQTDVLILGCGISGCAAALRLAKADVHVTLVSAASDVRESNSFFEQDGIAFLGEGDSADLFVKDLEAAAEGKGSPRAIEQLATMGPRWVQNLLIDELQVDFDRSPDGSWSLHQARGHSVSRSLRHGDLTGRRVLDRLLEKLQDDPRVEFVSNHTAVDLLTLAQHSTRPGDAYKKPTCVGAYVLDNATGKVSPFVAKETILATGGIAGLYPHTSSSATCHGDGAAMAHRAGARVMGMDRVEFHPLAFFAPNDTRVLLPDSLRQMGGRILSHRGEPLDERRDGVGPEASAAEVARQVYLEMVETIADHLWLDLTHVDSEELQEMYPGTYQHCLNKGFDPSKDLLPIVPAARYCNGGVAVDRTGQTSLQRLRACGEVACTGLHYKSRLPGVSLLAGLVWGLAAAEDITKQIQRFAYYMPEVNEWKGGMGDPDIALLQQDWSTLQWTMWHYLGVERDARRLRRGVSLLRDLSLEAEQTLEATKLCPESLALHNGLTMAMVMAES